MENLENEDLINHIFINDNNIDNIDDSNSKADNNNNKQKKFEYYFSEIEEKTRETKIDDLIEAREREKMEKLDSLLIKDVDENNGEIKKHIIERIKKNKEILEKIYLLFFLSVFIFLVFLTIHIFIKKIFCEEKKKKKLEKNNNEGGEIKKPLFTLSTKKIIFQQPHLFYSGIITFILLFSSVFVFYKWIAK